MGTPGERIKARRTALELSQKDVAAICKVSEGTVSFWESDTNQPKGKNLLKLAEALDKTPSWITTGLDTDPEQLKIMIGARGAKLLHRFDLLSEANQAAVLSLIESLTADKEPN